MHPVPVPVIVMVTYLSFRLTICTDEDYQQTYPFNFMELLKCKNSLFHQPSPLNFESVIEQAQEDAWLLGRVYGLHPVEKIPDVPRTLSHWDWLLRELSNMSIDFHCERNWKKRVARVLAWVETLRNLTHLNRKPKESTITEK